MADILGGQRVGLAAIAEIDGADAPARALRHDTIVAGRVAAGGRP